MNTLDSSTGCPPLPDRRSILRWLCGAALMHGPVSAQKPSAEVLSLRAKKGDPFPLADVQLFASPFKPYVRQLYSPSGIGMLADSPSDHSHHHGLMFAIGVEESDFWDEKGTPKAGRQEAGPEKERKITADGVASTLHWYSHEGKEVLIEQRRLRMFRQGQLPATCLEWRSQLTPSPSAVTPVRLWGRHYFGLGMRFVDDMANAAQFLWAHGKPGEVVRGDERLTPGDWCAAQGRIGGKPVTLVAVDHPGNPRPALWFTMATPFAYLSATLDLEKKPLDLPPGQTWDLCWAVMVLDGHLKATDIPALRESWLRGMPSRSGRLRTTS